MNGQMHAGSPGFAGAFDVLALSRKGRGPKPTATVTVALAYARSPRSHFTIFDTSFTTVSMSLSVSLPLAKL